MEDGLEKREPASPLGLAPGLIDPTPANVPHPFYHIVVTVVQLWLKDFQITHLQPRGRKWDLEVHGDWGPSPLLLIIGGQQLNLCTNLGFLHSSHSFYLPHNGILTSLVLCLPFHADNLHSTGIEGCWDPDLYLLGQQRRFEI